MGPIDPEFFTGKQMRAPLAARDIGTVYRLLRHAGLSQRKIAYFTGQSHYDAGLDATAHFTHALRLARQAHDTFGIANAAWHAAATLVRTGHPNDALKLLQPGQAQLRPRTEDLRVPTLTARLARTSATAYRRPPGMAHTTGHRPGNPTRHPRTRPNSPTNRHESNLTAYSKMGGFRAVGR